MNSKFEAFLKDHPFAMPGRPRPDHFSQQLLQYVKQVQVYEDIDAQEEALKCVPVDELHDKARLNTDKLTFEDKVLKELLAWFKNDFFKWMNEPACQYCNSKTQFKSMGQPSQEELRFKAYRVEVYECVDCKKQTRFPRFNDPVHLLKTREERCGGWANCFTLICRAMGYDVRLVVDYTDHVWTEVWSDSFNKFIHVDCCENAFNTPLLYEQGWGKKLNYCVAFAYNEVVDVSLKYTANWPEMLKRRTKLPEPTLRLHIFYTSRQLQQSMSSGQKQFLVKRQMQELLEMVFAERHLQLLPGRQSGSLEWRMARHELG